MYWRAAASRRASVCCWRFSCNSRSAAVSFLALAKQTAFLNAQIVQLALLARNSVIVLVSAISPYREIRQEMRNRIGRFIEVYVNAPLAVCEQRDVKGLYRRGRTEVLYRN